jgi:hypothetical protein
MAEVNNYTFSYKEVAEALVKAQGIHEGLWCISLEFGLGATNFGPNEMELKPAAIVPVLKIGLQRQTKETNLTVDAAKVNSAITEPIAVKQ